MPVGAHNNPMASASPRGRSPAPTGRLAPQRPRPPKKSLTCLGCGTAMWTDAGHRRCHKCRRRLKGVPDREAHATFEDGCNG